MTTMWLQGMMPTSAYGLSPAVPRSYAISLSYGSIDIVR